MQTDKWIEAICASGKMIEPFVGKQIRLLDNGNPAISYGLSSFGYDIRISPEGGMKYYTDFNWHGPRTQNGKFVDEYVVDPKQIDASVLWDLELQESPEGQYWILPSLYTALCVSVERFKMPGYVCGVATGKSTLARCGIIVFVTPLEPGWEGDLTIEIFNANARPVRIYANEGIAQIQFFASGEFPKTSYAARDGKYQHQQGLTLPRV